ncbi:TIGR01777 family oxidoreductase [Microbacterium lacusdiani]
MRVVIGGASGLIGSALTERLRARGDQVIRLVRRRAQAADETSWSPAEGQIDAGALLGADAVVNLSGASIARLPWTRAYRREILHSRVAATRTIVGALNALHDAGEPIPALVSGSASGFYGDRPGETLDESSPRGSGFLADVVSAWESEALAAPEGARVALARTGLVLARGDGALEPLRLLARLGLSGPISGGRQHWAWIALEDEVAGLLHLIDSDVAGPVNLVGPNPATAGDVVRRMAELLHRPYWLPLPLAALMGAPGRELLGADQQLRPVALTSSGFTFTHATVDKALAAALRPV